MGTQDTKESAKIKGVLIIASISSIEEEPVVRKWLEYYKTQFGDTEEYRALVSYLENKLLRLATQVQGPTNFNNKLSSRLKLKEKLANWEIRKKRLLNLK